MEPENTTEDWPQIDGRQHSRLANRNTPSDHSRTKYKGLSIYLPCFFFNILCIRILVVFGNLEKNQDLKSTFINLTN